MDTRVMTRRLAEILDGAATDVADDLQWALDILQNHFPEEMAEWPRYTTARQHLKTFRFIVAKPE
jgi:hypothetical protein